MNRFLVFSAVLLTALAFANGDCQRCNQARAQEIEIVDQSDVEVFLVSENDLNTHETDEQKESEELFRFPNVFDVFRTIF